MLNDLEDRFKVVLFDADGVLIRPPQLFSHQYASQRGLDPAHFEAFFRGDFIKATKGQGDLRELIKAHHDLWQWDDDPQKLLDMWFAAEHRVDQGLLAIVAACREAGIPVFVATVQEAHRARYLREVMFPGMFDGMFISCEIGHLKNEPQFWAYVLNSLRQLIPDISPNQVAYFDDRPSGVEAAQAAGISAYLYEHADQVRHVLATQGVLDS